MRYLLNSIKVFLVSLWTVLAAILGFLLLPFGQRNAVYITSQFWSLFILKTVGVKWRVKGLKNLPADRPVIIVSNHASHIDTPVLFKVVPFALYFVAKKELRKVPFMGWVMVAFGMIFVDRGNTEKAKKSLKKAAKQVQKGKSIVTFPEGTRSPDGKVRRFKKGAFALALQTKVEIVPVALKGTHEINPPGSYQLNSGLVCVHIGQPIPVEEQAGKTPGELAEFVKEKITTLFTEADCS